MFSYVWACAPEQFSKVRTTTPTCSWPVIFWNRTRNIRLRRQTLYQRPINKRTSKYIRRVSTAWRHPLAPRGDTAWRCSRAPRGAPRGAAHWHSMAIPRGAAAGHRVPHRVAPPTGTAWRYRVALQQVSVCIQGQNILCLNICLYSRSKKVRCLGICLCCS